MEISVPSNFNYEQRRDSSAANSCKSFKKFRINGSIPQEFLKPLIIFFPVGSKKLYTFIHSANYTFRPIEICNIIFLIYISARENPMLISSNLLKA